MQLGLAEIYLKRKSDTATKEVLEAALAYLDDPRYLPNRYGHYLVDLDLGYMSARKGNFDDARSHFEKALQLEPTGDMAYVYLGGVLLEKDNNFTQAVEYFTKALELNPINEMARYYRSEERRVGKECRSRWSP